MLNRYTLLQLHEYSYRQYLFLISLMIRYRYRSVSVYEKAPPYCCHYRSWLMFAFLALFEVFYSGSSVRICCILAFISGFVRKINTSVIIFAQFCLYQEPHLLGNNIFSNLDIVFLYLVNLLIIQMCWKPYLYLHYFLKQCTLKNVLLKNTHKFVENTAV